MNDVWPRAVLFDFDGVIVNSEPLHFQAFREVLHEENIELTEEAYYRDLLGFDDRGAFQYIFEKHGIPLSHAKFEHVMARKRDVMRQKMQTGEFSALPGAKQLVQKLAKRYPLAICSGALREEIETMLTGIGLRSCFKVIVSAEDVTIGKPDPSGYLQTTRLLAEMTQQPLTPADCLIIEDAPSVMQNVARVGFKVLGVATTYPLEQLEGAHWRVPSLEPQVVTQQIPTLKPVLG